MTMGASIVGGAAAEGDETLRGTKGDDHILGNRFGFGQMDGNHTIYGEQGNDYLHGSTQRDHLFGGPGDDTLLSGLPDPRHPETNRNLMDGGPGDDTLRTGYGNDTLVGGEGRDTFHIGGDHNRYQAQFPEHVRTLIRDFTPCEDQIVFNDPTRDSVPREQRREATENLAQELNSSEKIAEFLKSQNVTLENHDEVIGQLRATTNQNGDLVIQGNCIS